MKEKVILGFLQEVTTELKPIMKPIYGGRVSIMTYYASWIILGSSLLFKNLSAFKIRIIVLCTKIDWLNPNALLSV